MSRTGNCYHNAVAESFFASLEKDLLIGSVFVSRAHARHELFDYIEVFYNRFRSHSTIGYVSPLEFESLCDERLSA